MSDPQEPAVPPVPPVPPVVPQPAAQQPAATPPAAPRYGEYAPGYTPQQAAGYPAAPQQPAPGYQAPGYYYGQPAAPKRRTWDLVLTIVLLVLGLFGMLGGLVYAALFSSPEFVDEVFRQQGYSGFSGEIGAVPAIIAVSHILLYLVAVGLSILGLVRKWVVFYIPLVAGIIAAVIFWVSLVGIFLSDPGFVQQSTGY